jgi:quinol monooxygenase YgiN
MVTMRVESDRPDALLDLLARYVVVTRTHPGCRNIDLVASTTVPGRFLVVSKWATTRDQQRHFDSADLVALAAGCDGLLRSPAELDLYDGITMHDLA